jgi:hypothetical protein
MSSENAVRDKGLYMILWLLPLHCLSELRQGPARLDGCSRLTGGMIDWHVYRPDRITKHSIAIGKGPRSASVVESISIMLAMCL